MVLDDQTGRRQDGNGGWTEKRVEGKRQDGETGGETGEAGKTERRRN